MGSTLPPQHNYELGAKISTKLRVSLDRGGPTGRVVGSIRPTAGSPRIVTQPCRVATSVATACGRWRGGDAGSNRASTLLGVDLDQGSASGEASRAHPGARLIRPRSAKLFGRMRTPLSVCRSCSAPVCCRPAAGNSLRRCGRPTMSQTCALTQSERVPPWSPPGRAGRRGARAGESAGPTRRRPRRGSARATAAWRGRPTRSAAVHS
jgi:hypothetical protein